ncbi:MAG: FecR family protein, partial [Steroidobacteraceae bacterium]
MKSAAQIEQEAAEWLMRRDRGDPSCEGAQFEVWLAADSRHRAAYRNLEQLWSQSEGLAAWRPADGTVDAAVLKGSRTTMFGKWSFAIAASVLLIVAAGIMWLTTAAVGDSTYATEVGGYERVLLRDGSVIQLNTDTRVRVALGSDRRKVHLLRGEASFDVAHDPQRPFEVIAGETIVRAVGTAFTVRLRALDAVEVVVIEGSVTLQTNEARAAEANLAAATPPLLAAGERAVAGPTGTGPVEHIAAPEVARRLAWQVGELDFSG